MSKFEEIKNSILKIDVISKRRLRKLFYVNKLLKCNCSLKQKGGSDIQWKKGVHIV
ncbi:hypothetical protein CHCC20488_4114 [Bacillus paralicheniformis]|uniref:Uncharacterized protein n=1 Tax=Bacillus paralicheniformis TaxID=1648923 RepID=A0ABY3FZC0_9BACI|nr:hypothetical protein CHCC20497_2637 [Bacillus paralicheniformis]TWK44663.1 hypothetical protein CHCC20348_2290 [Bacillus paralicheniformis]TWK48352.1 hypothetical protein CHCC20347_0802 [Bacillus paralicheniformis]TWL41139.1 hypothetical protein CHCC15381_1938 [Bacillus paralicheniformis]TWN42709.1 hypothetical protein CHCC14523_0805 [Bacillus paralicheniformis]